MLRHRPLLEYLEVRAVPAILQDLSNGADPGGPAVQSAAPALDLAGVAFALTLPDAPADRADGPAFQAPTGQADPFLAHLKRLREEALEFPASGGAGGRAHRSDDLEAAPVTPTGGEAPAPEKAAPQGENNQAETGAPTDDGAAADQGEGE